MSAIKKAAPGAATPGNGTGSSCLAAPDNPRNDYTPRLRDRQEVISQRRSLGHITTGERSPEDYLQLRSLFARCRESVTAEAAAQRYGIAVKRGGALCPFHHDTRASLSFHNGRYRCFACEAHGDCIDFTARLLGLSPIEALRRLNDDFDLGLPLNRPLVGEELGEARQRSRSIMTRRRFETWRISLLNDLNAAYRIAHLALQSGRELTAQEKLAVFWMIPIAEWADALDSPSIEEQMSVLRDRKGVEQICKQILNHI